MRKLKTFLAICAVYGLALNNHAFAQALPFDWRNEVPDANDDFTRCMNRDRANADRTIRSCGRIIAERYSSEYTAAGYYSRGLMREMMQDPQGAREDFVNAERYFTVAIAARDRHTDAYRNRAAARYRLGRYQEAIADYQSALAVVTNARASHGTMVRSGVADLRPGQVAGLHYRIGGIHFRAGNWAEASAAFDTAASLEPDSSTFQSARCEARAAAREDLQAAGAACDLALQLSDRSDETLFSLGFLQFSQGDFAAAFATFSLASANDEENFLALYARGVSAARLGQTLQGDADIAAATRQIDASALAYYRDAGLRAEP